jgi:hypothetical protein
VLNYQPGFRPPAPSPAFGQKPFLGQVPLASAVRTISLLANPPTPFHYDLGGRRPSLNQTFDQLVGWPAFMGDILRVIFHGGTTWLGITVGLKEKNQWVSGIAWVLAVGNGLAGVADLISLVKRAAGVHPVEGCEKAPVMTSEPVPATPQAAVMPGTRSF